MNRKEDNKEIKKKTAPNTDQTYVNHVMLSKGDVTLSKSDVTQPEKNDPTAESVYDSTFQTASPETYYESLSEVKQGSDDMADDTTYSNLPVEADVYDELGRRSNSHIYETVATKN